jgi:hypothetical protein
MKWLFFGLPVAIIFTMLVIHASMTLDKIRDHWNEYRCNPIYMPFAGAIRQDVTTQENFLYCINSFGREIMKYPMDGIASLLKSTNDNLAEMTGPLAIFRSMFSRIRGFMLGFTMSTMSKAASSTSVFIHYLIKVRDMLKRFVGQGYIASFLTYTAFSFLESFIILFITILKTFVIVMLAISFVLALFQPELFAIVLALASILAAAGA